jgi:Domain of unknown function (DUF4349)
MRASMPILLATTALIAACSQQTSESSPATAPVTSADVREEAESAGGAPSMRAPGISPRSAPGVAFSYRYAFVLPDEAIAGVQESHASACEKLGPTQCRITGMRYTLVDEDRVQARLDFKLSPELARGFGKDGIAAVEKASGKLVDAAIEGEDVATQITISQASSAEAQAELKRIEARLAAGGLGESERTELQQQAARLRGQLSGERTARSEGEARLANTPMTYTYAGDAGFSLGGNPFGDAARSGWGSFVTMASFLLLATGVLLPWLLLAGLGWWAWRRWGPVRRPRSVVPAAPIDAPAG